MESMTDSMPSVSILLVEDTNVTLELVSILIPKKFPHVVLYTSFNGKWV